MSSATDSPGTDVRYNQDGAEHENRPYHHGSLRTALLEAAERGLREYGVDQLSLRELAREVGVSHAAPRRHFRDRQALLNALAVSGFERLHAQLGSAAAEVDGDFPGELHAVVRSYIHFATRDSALLELMYTSKHQEGAEEVQAASIHAFSLLNGVIARGRAGGHLTTEDIEQTGLVLFATMHGLSALANGNIVGRDRLDALIDTAIDQFLHGTGSAR